MSSMMRMFFAMAIFYVCLATAPAFATNCQTGGKVFETSQVVWSKHHKTHLYCAGGNQWRYLAQWGVTGTNDIAFVDGNVGIGTAMPQVKLHISAPANSDNVLLGELYTGTSGSEVPVEKAQLALSGQYNQGYNGYATPLAVKLWIGGYDNDNSVVYPLYIEDENNSPDFWIKNKPVKNGLSTAYFQGNVGIGTTNPQAQLDVSNPSGVLGTVRRYVINQTLFGPNRTEDANGVNYIILHRMFEDGGEVYDHALSGTITLRRGGTDTWNRKWTVQVNSATAYRTTRLSLLSFSEQTEPVVVTYGGEQYLALQLRNSSALYEPQYTGWITMPENAVYLRLVYDQDITAVEPYDPTATTESSYTTYKRAADVLGLYGGARVTGDIALSGRNQGNGYTSFLDIPSSYSFDVAATDGFRIYLDATGVITGNKNNDFFVFEKTDGNSSEPDGGMYFANRGMDNVSQVALMIRGNGNVGIGTTAPSHRLHVNGVARSTQASFATSSDLRVKEAIEPLSEGIETIMRLRPVSFRYKPDYAEGKQGMDGLKRGFIAQEVETVVPEMVTRTEEEIAEGTTVEDFRILNNADFTPILVKAVQELKAENDALRAEIEGIKSMMKP